MNAQKRLTLSMEWGINQAELRRLQELPVGILDPATLESRVMGRQREIEAQIDSQVQDKKRAQ